MSTQSQEDYLRTIYGLYKKNMQHATSVEVADCLEVSKAAVSKMLKRLSIKKLIKIYPYSKIILTAKGLKEAKKLTSKHRIIEVFLVDILKINKDKMHEEAHRLEHSFSDESIKKLARFLNNPKFSPRGNKIFDIK